jgi:hypothetical protein
MRRTLSFFGVALAIGAFVTSASAGIVSNDLTLSVDVGGDTYEWAPGGGPNPNGNGWGYHGNRSENHSSGGSWDLQYDIEASRDEVGSSESRAAQTAFVFNNLVMTNNTGATQTVSITTMVPIGLAILPSSLMGGSASGTITTNGDGGSMSNISALDPMYRALIDGLAVGGVGDLHNFDSSISVVGFGSNSTGFEDFGTPIPSAPGPAVNASIGITLQFDLTDGDSASWTSNFVVNVVPTPASGAGLALAGIAAIRRRR